MAYYKRLPSVFVSIKTRTIHTCLFCETILYPHTGCFKLKSGPGSNIGTYICAPCKQKWDDDELTLEEDDG